MLKITEQANEFVGYMAGECLSRNHCKDIDSAFDQLNRRFPQFLVYRGGHHVAVIDQSTQKRLLLITE